VSSDAWAEATFEGFERARRRRVAAWTPQERLAWLDAVVLDLQRSGMLDEWRGKKQRAVVAEWEAAQRRAWDSNPRGA